jgi:hypothetical protein
VAPRWRHGGLRSCSCHSDLPRGELRQLACSSITTRQALKGGEQMTDQTTLLPRFAREIVVHETGYSIREVLEEMATRDYSQVLVRVVRPYQAYRDEQQEENDGPGGRTYPLRLLTHEAVGRYVRACWDDDYVDLKHIGIEDVLSDEPDGTMVIMAGDRTIGEARAALVRLSDPRVYAVVITDTGDAFGQPCGLVTPWDLQESAADDA